MNHARTRTLRALGILLGTIMILTGCTASMPFGSSQKGSKEANEEDSKTEEGRRNMQGDGAGVDVGVGM